MRIRWSGEIFTGIYRRTGAYFERCSQNQRRIQDCLAQGADLIAKVIGVFFPVFQMTGVLHPPKHPLDPPTATSQNLLKLHRSINNDGGQNRREMKNILALPDLGSNPRSLTYQMATIHGLPQLSATCQQFVHEMVQACVRRLQVRLVCWMLLDLAGLGQQKKMFVCPPHQVEKKCGWVDFFPPFFSIFFL